MNRLKLDWNLNTSLQRKEFINNYIKTLKDPTEEELETIANYLLWGKDNNGESAVDRGEIEIETRNKTWQKKGVESLEFLMESPIFNEATFKKINSTPFKAKQDTFSREEALEKCPESMRQTFIDLFRQIDELDLCTNFYDIAHGKRKNPPRKELLANFSEEQQEKMRERVSHWNQYTYLKQRHFLVELRRQQFTLRDSYSSIMTRETPPEFYEEDAAPDFDAEIPVFPLGLFSDRPLSGLIFRDKKFLNPFAYTEDTLKQISDFFCQKHTEARPQFFFDFCNLEHVYQLFQKMAELDGFGPDNSTNLLIRTLKYYLGFAELNEVQREILDFKIKKAKNQDIADYINQKFGKSYTANYISTIFRQKIIPKVNEAAAFHQKIISNLFFEEEFKKCSCCGNWLLRDSSVFVKKSRAKDGLANRCKKCDREDRMKKKEAKQK